MSRPYASYGAWQRLVSAAAIAASRSFRPLPFFGSRRIRARLFPDGDLCGTPYAPALVASVGLGAELSGAHRRHVCGPAMRATRIAHRVEGFCRNGRRKATWSSGGRLRYRMPCSAPFGRNHSAASVTSSKVPMRNRPTRRSASGSMTPRFTSPQAHHYLSEVANSSLGAGM